MGGARVLSGETWAAATSFPFASALAECGKLAVGAPRNYPQSPDATLIAWSAEGDRRAFDQIVVRHGAFALRVAARVVGDRALAEEAAQEAMLRAWMKSAQFDPARSKFTTWLYRIVVNLCIDQRRRIQPEPMPENLDLADTAAGADERLEECESRALLVQAIADLPPRQRAVLSLVYDEGASGGEAAEILGLSAKAVERLLARARAALRDRLRPQRDGRGK